MKRSVLMLMIVLFLSSCVTTDYFIKLKSNYQRDPYVITTSKTKNEVWNKIIELFATKGIPIHMIDKDSGLIISQVMSFISNYTYEDPDGNLIKPNAYIITERYKPSLNSPDLTELTAQWNIFVSESDGKTKINVNLLNIKAIDRYRVNNSIQEYERIAYSTGVFERTLADYLK